MVDKKFRAARVWSNQCLEKYASMFQGDIVNVSAWIDTDKNGRFYKEYFTNADNYYITNYTGYRGVSGNTNEIFLNLEENLSEELVGRFDVVFNHTTLEHIFNVEKAFKNLCKMAREAVIIVVPFIQVQHTSESYKDFWRFTPFCIEQLFENSGFTLTICEFDNSFNTSVYLFCIGIRNEVLSKYTYLKKCNIEELGLPGEWVGAEEK